MQTFKNDFGGMTITLGSIGDLSSLPSDLSTSLPDAMVKAFENPVAWLNGIKKQSNRKSLKQFLDKCCDFTSPELWIVDPNFQYPTTIAGLKYPNSLGGTYFIHPQTDSSYSGRLPDIFEHFEWINWCELGSAGQLDCENRWCEIAGLEIACNHPTFSEHATQIFATSQNGDMMVCNSNEIAGYVSHENGEAYEFGSLDAMVDWVLDSLSNGKTPQFDWDQLANDENN